jgi:ornithine cyclodeaminase
MHAAIEALESALRSGLDPSADPPRTVLAARAGQVLLMPSEAGGAVGVKLVSVAPDNPASRLPLVQGVYVLFDGATLAPIALLDGAALTSLRTPAVSAVAVRHLASPSASRLVVFGTGPQAWGHVEAVAAVRPITDVSVVGRDDARTAVFVARASDHFGEARVGDASAVAEADVVVCATTAGEPLFDGDLVPSNACVVAVGAHQPDRRELDASLMRRAQVVVEDVDTALREAGDVILAVGEEALSAAALVGLADVVTGRQALESGRPRVFKSVGMAWEDLVVASAAHQTWGQSAVSARLSAGLSARPL